MQIEGLAVDVNWCPDGVELVDLTAVGGAYGPEPRARARPGQPYGPIKNFDGPEKRAFRYRTVRRDARTWTIDNLENPIVIAFVNATDDEQRLLFFGQYGLGCPHESWNIRGLRLGKLKAEQLEWLNQYTARTALHYAAALRQQSHLRDLLHSARGEDFAAAMAKIDAALGHGVPFSSGASLIPTFHLAGPRGTPRLLLKTDTFFDFMLMEIAMIVANGVAVHECEQCHILFTTGPLTWRRRHARFCTDRCRVAAMRVRKAAAEGESK